METARLEWLRRFTEKFSDMIIDADSPAMRELERSCVRNLEQKVKDPQLLEKLRPHYRAGCKRLVASPDFYEAIQKPNARLVTEPIACIEAAGVRTRDGELHALDVLVLATGFKVDQFMRPMEVCGRDGKRLSAVWAQRPEAYLSISIPDFPNLFMLNGPNGPVGNISLIEVAERQMGYVLQLIRRWQDGHCSQICATDEATRRFSEEREQQAKRSIWYTGCRSWYLDDRGIPAVWPFTFDRFVTEMRQPRLEDYEERA
jgi:cation diffusion facilitator CzcD-associated flavoprotein CzcO